ncbi:MAG TPA: ATP-binding cassette domain-containing protein, partial [Pseudonocardia sp.]|nr:ATP-binding cassette domain-containing protein [Pseudonocardia sp.]
MSIVVTDLAKRYGAVAAVDGLPFTARSGRVTGFLGPNGSGKTTTLRCLSGLLAPDSGAATIGGVPFAALADPIRQAGVALDPAAHHPDRTGRDHLRVLALAGRLPGSRVQEVLDLVELGAADRRAGTYSLGMRQRLHLAAALLGDPQVVVLDEPANGLDPSGIRWLRDFLRALAAEGRCVLLSSHQLREVQETVDDVVVVAAGRAVARGTLDGVLGGGGGVRARTPEPARLAALLREKGARVVADGETLRVEGVSAEDLAR